MHFIRSIIVMKTLNLIYKKWVKKCKDLTHEETENYVYHSHFLLVSCKPNSPFMYNHVTLDYKNINLTRCEI